VKKTIVKIKKMDCPSEIKLIEGLTESIDSTAKMEFDLESRIVHFYHSIDKQQIMDSLKDISLPGELVSSEEIAEDKIPDIAPSVEAKTLKYLLAINLTMFIVEIFLGLYAESTGLLADGLDMLADSFVYGLSLYAVGRTIAMKHRAAYFSGIMQISLGLLCLVEVGRKFYVGSEPLSNYMIVVSVIALIANLWCLVLIHKHKDGEVHMKASWIFSANDVIVNTGVIISGVLVYFLKSNIPDLLIGGIVSFIVIRGGISIIKMSKLSILDKKEKRCCH
jgi:Co/Zn/Cd efflux system component